MPAPMIVTYCGRNIEEMEAPELREALREAAAEIEAYRRSQAASDALFGRMLQRRAEELRGMRA